MTGRYGDIDMIGDKKRRVVFLSFADSRMKRSAARIRRQAVSMDCFDEIVVLDEKALRSPDLSPWQKLFSSKVRGYGYWCWKPYLIEQTMRRLNEGDVLLYCDAGTYLNPAGKPRFQDYLHVLEGTTQGILAFDSTEYPECPYLERQWDKGDLIHVLGCEGRTDILDSPQVAATQILVRRCGESLQFLHRWNEIWMRDFHMIDDSLSELPNAEDFRQHRHDQSIFSLLYKLAGGRALPYDEKYSRDWSKMQRFPIWSVRDRGNRFFPFLGYCLYWLLSYCPLASVRNVYQQKASALYKRRPWLWKCPSFMRP